jgi:hypothetical protein
MFYHRQQNIFNFYRKLVIEELAPYNFLPFIDGNLFKSIQNKYNDYENRLIAINEAKFYFEEITWTNSEGKEIHEEAHTSTGAFLVGLLALMMTIGFSTAAYYQFHLNAENTPAVLVSIFSIFLFSLFCFFMSYKTSEYSQQKNIINETKATLRTIIKQSNNYNFFHNAMVIVSEGNESVPDDYIDNLRKELNPTP